MSGEEAAERRALTHFIFFMVKTKRGYCYEKIKLRFCRSVLMS